MSKCHGPDKKGEKQDKHTEVAFSIGEYRNIWGFPDMLAWHRIDGEIEIPDGVLVLRDWVYYGNA